MRKELQVFKYTSLLPNQTFEKYLVKWEVLVVSSNKMNCRLCIVFAFVVFGAASALYECDVDGKLYPNAYNCTQYMQCNYKANGSNQVNRQFESRPCAPGTEFNAKTSVSSLNIWNLGCVDLI